MWLLSMTPPCRVNCLYKAENHNRIGSVGFAICAAGESLCPLSIWVQQMFWRGGEKVEEKPQEDSHVLRV